MINITETEQALLALLGTRLKKTRLARNESQEIFAQRLGITRQTYSKMEKGSPQIPIGYWLMVSSIMGRLDSWNEIMQEKQNLFSLYEQEQLERTKASGRRKKK